MVKSTNAKFLLPLLLLIFFALFFCLSGCGGSKDTTTTTPTPPAAPVTAASLALSALPTTVKSDGSTTTTITVTALNAAHAALSGVTVTMGADTGILGAAAVVTDDTGQATLIFSAGGNPINRTATITATAPATAGTVSAQIPVQIVGSTITLTPLGTTTLPDDGSSPVTLTVTAKDAGGNPVENAAVTLTKTGTGSVTITPASGNTLADGTFQAAVAGAAAGAVTLTATALGTTATKAVSVTPTLATFAIDQQTLCNPGCAVLTGNPNPTAMKTLTDSLAIEVNAPSQSNVTFVTPIGVFTYVGNPNPPNSMVTVPVAAGKATATLTTSNTGIANVQVYDTAHPATSATLTVAMTSSLSPDHITLQASPTVVPMSVGTTTGSSTLIATVQDIHGNPIGGASVAFSIINPDSGGETVSPVVVLTADTTTGGLSLGQARASFTSGSLPSAGIEIRASVVGTAIATGPSPLGNPPSGMDAYVSIGGQAGSIAFGQATQLAMDTTNANYILQMSVLVADVNGTAVSGAVVSLRGWPIAWSTGTDCMYDADNGTDKGTFFNEDINENLHLDPSEDGNRIYYAGGSGPTGMGTVDGFLTPPNSAGGTLPATVTTDVNGVAGFNLTYTKNSSIWTVIRIRATTLVSGTETRGEIIFRLRATVNDVGPPCLIPDSPYIF